MNDISVAGALVELLAAQARLAAAVAGNITDAELLAVIAGVTRHENEIAALRIRCVNGILQQRLCAGEADLPLDASDDLRERRMAKVARVVNADVALARQVPGHESSRQVRTAERLCTWLPHTLDQVAAGGLTEQRAMIIAEASKVLPCATLAEFDEHAAAECVGKADRTVRNTVRGLIYRLDPLGTVERNRKAVSERYASTRPVAEGMAQLSIVAPLPMTIAAFASLDKHAEMLRLAGDPRPKAQIIADTAIARLTCGAVQGCSDDGVALRWSTPTVPCPTTLPDGAVATADTTVTGPVAAAPQLHLHLILTDQTLLGGDEPALLVGHGPVPAFVARQLAAMGDGQAQAARTVIRRYLTDPVRGRLVDCDPTARVFPQVLKDFLLVRDRECRTPYCGAPVREFDHVAPYAQGGATAIDNGQGLCRSCNLAKEAAGWHQSMDRDGSIVTSTPDGAVLRSPEPKVPGRFGGRVRPAAEAAR